MMHVDAGNESENSNDHKYDAKDHCEVARGHEVSCREDEWFDRELWPRGGLLLELRKCLRRCRNHHM